MSLATNTSGLRLTLGRLARAIFAHALNHQPAIIFIDHIDSLTGTDSTCWIRSRLFIEWSKLERTGSSVIVLGATNLPTLIDPEFLRHMPERFYVRGPGQAQRRELFVDMITNFPNTIPLHDPNAPRSLDFVLKWCPQATVYTRFDILHCVKSARAIAKKEMICSQGFVEVCHILSSTVASKLPLIAIVKIVTDHSTDDSIHQKDYGSSDLRQQPSCPAKFLSPETSSTKLTSSST